MSDRGTPLGTLCGANIMGLTKAERDRYSPTTVGRHGITCPKCLTLLASDGWGAPDGAGSRRCPDCARYPNEGHLPECSYVRRFGVTPGVPHA